MKEKEGKKIPPALIYVVLLLIGFKTIVPKFFDQSTYRGDGFSVTKLKGWEMQKDKTEVSFFSPEKDVYTEAPVAVFSIYSEKQKGALFMDDFFPEVLSAVRQQGGKVLNSGEEKIDGQVARWFMARFDKMDIAVVSLYLADDFNRLTRIQYIGKVKKFKEYGKEFDQFKKTIKLKKVF